MLCALDFQVVLQPPHGYLADGVLWAWGHAPSKRGRPSFSSAANRAHKNFTDGEEAAFKEWWLESRATSLQPRKESLPSAKQRLEAVRLRVVARGDAT